jgi:hypothetical protein
MADRELDLKWIDGNLKVLATAAIDNYANKGRGIVVSDHTKDGVIPPTIYLPQAKIPQEDDQVARLVREYDPSAEGVLLIFKRDGRAASYRFRIPSGDGTNEVHSS